MVAASGFRVWSAPSVADPPDGTCGTKAPIRVRFRLKRAQVNREGFNAELALPYSLRLEDFALAMDDVYVLLGNVNEALVGRGCSRLKAASGERSIRGS